jgi:hypothetical protein
LLAGVDAAVTAAYVGHADNGYLIYKTYNVTGKTALTEGAAKINAHVVSVTTIP